MAWEIVVAAGAQPLHAVVDLAERGQNEHRGVVGARAKRSDERQAVPLRQHAVDDQHVVAAGKRQREALLAIRSGSAMWPTSPKALVRYSAAAGHPRRSARALTDFWPC